MVFPYNVHTPINRAIRSLCGTFAQVPPPSHKNKHAHATCTTSMRRQLCAYTRHGRMDARTERLTETETDRLTQTERRQGQRQVDRHAHKHSYMNHCMYIRCIYSVYIYIYTYLVPSSAPHSQPTTPKPNDSKLYQRIHSACPQTIPIHPFKIAQS